MSARKPTDAEIEAAAEYFWNHTQGRYSGMWKDQPGYLLATDHFRALAEGALRAAFSLPLHQIKGGERS